MRKRLIIIGAIVVVLVGTVAVLMANLGAIVNRNKDFFLSRAEKAIGREVSVGEIGVTLRGGIGVRLDDVTVADDPAFSPEPFLRAEQLQVNARLLPLLKKEFQVKQVVLREPVIRIIRDEAGRLNTESFGGRAAAADTTAGAVTAGAGAAAPLIVSLVDIDNGIVHFADRAQDVDVTVSRIKSRVSDLEYGKPISIAIEAAVLSDERNVSVRGTFGPVGEDRDIRNISVDAEAKAGPVDLAELMRNFPRAGAAVPAGATLDGRVSFAAKASGALPDIGAAIEIDATETGIRIPKKLNKPAGTPLRISANATAAGDKIALSDMEIVFHNAKASGGGEYVLGEKPSFDLALDVPPTGLEGWGAFLPALSEYAPAGQVEFNGRLRGAARPEPGTLPEITGKMAIRGGSLKLPQLVKPLTDIQSDVTFAGRTATVGKTSANLGGSRVDGTATVEKFTPPTVRYRATSPSLALADVKPPNPKLKKPEVMKDVVAEGTMVGTEEPTNRGTLKSSSGSIGSVDYQSLRADYSVAGKTAKISNVDVRAMEGQLTGSGTVMMDETSPSFQFDAKGRGLQIAQALDRIPSVTRQFVRGPANVDLVVTGSGKEWPDVQKTIRGDGNAEVFTGELVDINIFNTILSEITTATGFTSVISQGLKDKYPNAFKAKNTKFKDLKSTFVIENGRLLARNLRIDASDYVMTGKGGVDFNGDLELHVTLLVSKTFSSDIVRDFKQAAYLTNNQGQVEVPFVLTGRLPKVKANPEAGFINQVIQRAFSSQGQGLIDKGLENLLGRKKSGAPADTTKQP